MNQAVARSVEIKGAFLLLDGRGGNFLWTGVGTSRVEWVTNGRLAHDQEGEIGWLKKLKGFQTRKDLLLGTPSPGH
jgi:hypothetical protein